MVRSLSQGIERQVLGVIFAGVVGKKGLDDFYDMKFDLHVVLGLLSSSGKGRS